MLVFTRYVWSVKYFRYSYLFKKYRSCVCIDNVGGRTFQIFVQDELPEVEFWDAYFASRCLIDLDMWFPAGPIENLTIRDMHESVFRFPEAIIVHSCAPWYK